MKPILIVCLLFCTFTACNRDRQVSEALNLFGQGKDFEKNGLPDSAIHRYRQAADVLKDSREYGLTGEIYNRLGDILLANRAYTGAFPVYRDALECNLKQDDKTNASRSLRGMGKSYVFRYLPDSALTYFINASRLSAQIKDSEELALIHDNLSATYYELKQYSRSMKHNTLSLQLSKDSTAIYRNYYARADLFALSGQKDSAWHYYLMGSRCSAIRTKAACYLYLSKMAKETNHPDYIKYLELFNVLRDSIERSVQLDRVNSVERQYAQKAVAKQTVSEEKNKYTFLIVLILVFVVCMIVFLVRRYRSTLTVHRSVLKETTQNMEGKLLEASRQKDSLQKKLEYYLKSGHQNDQTISEINAVADKCAKRFIKSEAYLRVKEELDKRNHSPLSNEKQALFSRLITDAFRPYTKCLSVYLVLSPEDEYLCCLSALKFSTEKCASLRGVSNEGIRSQRSRIRKKEFLHFNSYKLFNHIFPEIK